MYQIVGLQISESLKYLLPHSMPACSRHTRVMSRTSYSTNESSHERTMSMSRTSHATKKSWHERLMTRTSDVTNESCNEGVMSYVCHEKSLEYLLLHGVPLYTSRMSHVTDKLCHEGVRSRRSHVTNESGHERVMLRTRHVAYVSRREPGILAAAGHAFLCTS